MTDGYKLGNYKYLHTQISILVHSEHCLKLFARSDLVTSMLSILSIIKVICTLESHDNYYTMFVGNPILPLYDVYTCINSSY